MPADGGVMGTSTRWKGPRGDRWSAAARRLARWDSESRNADQRLEEIAADHLRALHETVRADPSAFGLYGVVCEAGERLAHTLGSLATKGVRSEGELVARLVSEVGADGGTLADAAVRRGVAEAVRNVRERHREWGEAMADAPSSEGGFAWDILCDLYRMFFADTVGEFLRSVVAEHVRQAAPVLVVADPEGRIADWVAEKLVGLVPNPCEEAVDAVPSAEGDLEEPLVLPEIAEALVPRAVGKVLGLAGEEITGDEGVAA